MPDIFFTKENLDKYLKELAKEFRRLNGSRMRAELILVGGASILVNYGFREMTYDIDAYIQASSSMKDAINQVGDRLGLPNGWMNTDFTRTTSYTSKLAQYSKYYKTFSNILEVRTIAAEYLVVMKLMAGRQYKNDLSDVIGILLEQQMRGDAIPLEIIRGAAENLYGSYNNLPKESRTFIEAALSNKDLKSLYENVRKDEQENKDILLEFQEDYPHVLNNDNLASVLQAARTKKEKQKK